MSAAKNSLKRMLARSQAAATRAGKPPARICEGEAKWPGYSTMSLRDPATQLILGTILRARKVLVRRDVQVLLRRRCWFFAAG